MPALGGVMQHHDLSLLFSLGLVGCSLDVGDALTAGSFSSTHTSSAGHGMGGGTDESTGDASDDASPPADEGSNADETGPVTGAPTTAPSGEAEGSSSGGDPSTSAGESGGMYSELCATWDTHAAECGFGTGAGAICQYDLDYGSYFGDACAAALEDYYSCLASTDCAELANADPDTVCGRDQVATQCGG